MQAIATENNLSETAFFVKNNRHYEIRWFTPKTEVALCGHATLASAYVLFKILGVTESTLHFQSQSGLLKVSCKGDLITLDFPAQPPQYCDAPAEIVTAFNSKPVACLKAEDYLLVFNSEKEVSETTVKLDKLQNNQLRGVIITAASQQYDFISRFFSPNYGIDEDPVTGSAYTQLVPYWSQQLDKQHLTAKQVSKRGGQLWLEQHQDRVFISGKAILYMQGEINI